MGLANQLEGHGSEYPARVRTEIGEWATPVDEEALKLSEQRLGQVCAGHQSRARLFRRRHDRCVEEGHAGTVQADRAFACQPAASEIHRFY